MAMQPGRPATFVEGFHDEEAVKKMPYRQLSHTGWTVAPLALGGSAFGSVFGDTSDTESAAVIRSAIQRGINLVDTAPWYGHGKSERVLGQTLPHLPRDSFYLMSKVGRYKPNVQEMFDFRAERVLASIDESLERLGVAYLDVGQVHDPEFAPSLDLICSETLPALLKAKEAGKIRHIGITGYPLDVHHYLVEHSPVRIDTALTYCHYTLNDSTLLEHLDFYAAHDIDVINASALSMGLLSTDGPPSWHPAGPAIKAACQDALALCQSRGVNLSRLALHYSLSNPRIATTLVSTAHLAQLEANLDVCLHGLAPVETSTLDELCTGVFGSLHGKETWEGVEVDNYWKQLGQRPNVTS